MLQNVGKLSRHTHMNVVLPLEIKKVELLLLQQDIWKFGKAKGRKLVDKHYYLKNLAKKLQEMEANMDDRTIALSEVEESVLNVEATLLQLSKQFSVPLNQVNVDMSISLEIRIFLFVIVR